MWKLQTFQKQMVRNVCVCLLIKLLVHSVLFCSKGLTQGFIHITWVWGFISFLSGQLYTQTQVSTVLHKKHFYVRHYNDGHKIGLIGAILGSDWRVCLECSAFAFFSHMETKQQLSNYFKVPGRNLQADTQALTNIHTDISANNVGQNYINGMLYFYNMATPKQLCAQCDRIAVSLKIFLSSLSAKSLSVSF